MFLYCSGDCGQLAHVCFASNHVFVRDHSKAIAMFKDVNDVGRQLRTLHNAALSYLHLRDFDAADGCMAAYREATTDAEEAKGALANYETARAVAQSPSAQFAGIMSSAAAASRPTAAGSKSDTSRAGSWQHTGGYCS